MKRGMCGIPWLYMMIVTFLQPKVAGGAKDGVPKSCLFNVVHKKSPCPKKALFNVSNL